MSTPSRSTSPLPTIQETKVRSQSSTSRSLTCLQSMHPWSRHRSRTPLRPQRRCLSRTSRSHRATFQHRSRRHSRLTRNLRRRLRTLLWLLRLLSRYRRIRSLHRQLSTLLWRRRPPNLTTFHRTLKVQCLHHNLILPRSNSNPTLNHNHKLQALFQRRSQLRLILRRRARLQTLVRYSSQLKDLHNHLHRLLQALFQDLSRLKHTLSHLFNLRVTYWHNSRLLRTRNKHHHNPRVPCRHHSQFNHTSRRRLGL